MKGYSVYNAIQQLKEQGFKKAAVARQLSINRRTVDRYWDMPVDEYQSMHTEIRKCQYLDEYRDTIIGWIEDYPDMSAAQICDWLKENYEVDFKDRTVSRYVSELRKSCNLPKHKEPRSYEAAPSPITRSLLTQTRPQRMTSSSMRVTPAMAAWLPIRQLQPM